jgi:hypothetical protein
MDRPGHGPGSLCWADGYLKIPWVWPPLGKRFLSRARLPEQ